MRTLKSMLAAVALLALPLFGLAAEAAAPAVQDTLHAATNAVGEAAAAHPEGGEHGKVAHTLPLAAPVIKSIQITDGFAFKITNSMLVMALVALGLIVFAQLATKNVQLVPKGLQNFAEWVVESLSDFLAGILGPKLTKQTFWFFATVFLFILSANWFGLLPGVGTFGWGETDSAGHLHITHPVLRGANADMNMTLALALGFFMMWIIWSIQHNGVGGVFSHIFVYHGEAQGGMRMMLFVMFFLVGFLEVISIMIRPVTLNFRLFGNVYAGETLLETMLHKGGFLAALPFYFLELMVGAIQALVFTLLTAVFTALMCRHDDAHEAAGEKEAAHR
ncbi:MAG: synthase subunit [Verrucomicrobia bacterium]|jgi:F-type H+-transporting ATPase subunit a|nr:synthase subunit [Verrucomicrobiota bacterium]